MRSKKRSQSLRRRNSLQEREKPIINISKRMKKGRKTNRKKAMRRKNRKSSLTKMKMMTSQ